MFNGQVIDVNKLIKDNFDIKGGTIFFMGIKLQGASENENEPLWFGELNNDELDSSKPIYRLLGDKDNERQQLRYKTRCKERGSQADIKFCTA